MLAKLTITNLPLHKHLQLKILHTTHTYVPQVTAACYLILAHKVILQIWLVIGFFLTEVLLFCKPHQFSNHWGE